MFFTIEQVRERMVLMDRGFAYFEKYKLAQDSIGLQDSIIDVQQKQLIARQTQLNVLSGQLRISKQLAQTNLDLAKGWKKEARKYKRRLFVVAPVAVVVGYLVGK